MAGPSWLRWLLAAAFLAVAGYCVLRLVAAHRAPSRYRGCHRALDVAHLIMALGMAVMCSPIGGPLPAAGWQTVFLLMAAWFLGTAWHRRRTRIESIGWHGAAFHHAIAAIAMLYMLTAMPGDAGHMSGPWMPAMPAPAGDPLGWLLASYFACSAVLLACRALRKPVPTGNSVPVILLASRTTAGCQVIMALGTAYLLLPIT